MSKQTELAQVADTITVNSGNIGIGTTPSTDWRTAFNTTALQVGQSGSLFNLDVSNSDRRYYMTSNALLNSSGDFQHILEGPVTVYGQRGGEHLWYTAASGSSGATASMSEAMRLDASGNLLVGTTNITPSINAVEGIALSAGSYGGRLEACRDGGAAVSFGRLTSDGDIMDFKKDGTTVGSIGTANSTTVLYLATSTSGIAPSAASNSVFPSRTTGVIDNTLDLGSSGYRWNDAYITNGVTTGSDGNDKQDIRDLTEAEQRVAVACKGLLKAWRWKSAVEEKGDDARIHCGIIAQDLQAAFAAEGLDAGRYAMFISSTWWEHDVEVLAVEAVAEVLDDDGNVVTEAVEAKDAYTRTDTYDTQEEAPEGATERTRLGVRYSELLAFIIGAL